MAGNKMKHLTNSHKQILWMNILALAGGIGFMVYKKWQNPLYAFGAAALIAVIEYYVMGYSLLRKQQKENERRK